MHLRQLILILVLLAPELRHAPGQTPLFQAVEEVVPADQLLAVADFDGDGDPDLLTGSPEALFVNDGHANFATAAPAPPFLLAGWIVAATGDVDGDGRADAITVRFLATPGPAPVQETALWRNTASGWVSRAYGVPPLPAGFLLDRIQLADLDGDLDLDAVLSTVPAQAGAGPGAQGPVRVWLSTGSGTFFDFPGAMPVPAASARAVLPADLDGDGDIDLLVSTNASGTSARLLCWNNSSGAFSVGGALPGAGSCIDVFAAGDLDGNGFQDVVAQGGSGNCVPPRLDLFFSFGGGAFTPAPAAFEDFQTWPVALDLDGDGRDELLRAGFGGLAAHAAGPLTGSGPAVRSWPASGDTPRSADLDQDGDVDLLVRTVQGIRVLLGDGHGDLLPLAGRISSPPSLVSPVLADADGDGDEDVIGARAGGTVLGTPLLSAWNDGHGRFAWEPDPSPGPAPFSFAMGISRIRAGDLDGDGDADLAATGLVPANGGPLQDAVIWNQGAAWTSGPVLDSGAMTSAVRLADIDGDADVDIIALSGQVAWIASPVPPLRVFRNEGVGGFAPPEPIPGAAVGPGFAVLDVDADGDADLILARSPSPGASEPPGVLLLNDGSGSFSPASGLPPVAFTSISTGDLDGDGDPDLLLDQRVMRNDGLGGFAVAGALPGWTFASAAPGGGSLLGDVDGDGDVDVIDRGARLFRNLGGGVFSWPEPAAPSSPPVRIPAALADLDGDGDLDLLTDGPRILLNLRRQLVPVRRTRLGHPASLEILGPSAGAYALWAAAAPEFLPMPPYGTLFLDSSTMLLVSAGALDVSGRTILEAFVPADPALAGLRLFWQAASTGQGGPRLGNQLVTALSPY